MTLAARLEDLEVTLEHMLMDVFVSLPIPAVVFLIAVTVLYYHKVNLTEFIYHRLSSLLSPVYNCNRRPEANICSRLYPDALSLIGIKRC